MMAKQRRGRRWLYVLVILALVGVFSSGAKAQEEAAKGWAVEFHGFVESNVVVRDQNGIQNGFMDHLDAIQQRNTLKFDVDVDPGLAWESFSLAKIHLTYRGAYDSIFDLRKGAYGDIDNKGGPSRFDYGKRDIKYENDLREAFVDLTYTGPMGVAFFRPGRQIVSWGEVSGATILDVINPPDNSFQMFFQNPDDLKIPLWMGRFNYSPPTLPGAVKLNFDLLFIPDIRPAQFGPLDSSMEAPYVSITAFSKLKGLNVRQDVPTDEREYGGKLTADIGERLSVSLVYFRDVDNDAAIKLTDFFFTPVGLFPRTAFIVHPKEHVYGAYLSYNFTPLNIVIRGEFGRQTNAVITGGTLSQKVVLGQPVLPFGPKMETQAYRLKPVTQWMIGVDKPGVWIKWLFPHDPVSLGFQWIHKMINQWDHDLEVAKNNTKVPVSAAPARNLDLFSFSLNGYWWSGKLNPNIAIFYSPEGGGKGGGSWMTRGSLQWDFTPHLYMALTAQYFLGNNKSRNGYANFIDNCSETSYKIGYQW